MVAIRSVKSNTKFNQYLCLLAPRLHFCYFRPALEPGE